MTLSHAVFAFLFRAPAHQRADEFARGAFPPRFRHRDDVEKTQTTALDDAETEGHGTSVLPRHGESLSRTARCGRGWRDGRGAARGVSAWASA